MKQLINKYDKEVRLVGLKEAEQREDWHFVRFLMPTNVGEMWCVWSTEDWLLADMEEGPRTIQTSKGESLEFRVWLRDEIKRRGYAATGLSESLGFSHNWLFSILSGRRKLTEKNIVKLAEALGIRPSLLKAHKCTE